MEVKILIVIQISHFPWVSISNFDDVVYRPESRSEVNILHPWEPLFKTLHCFNHVPSAHQAHLCFLVMLCPVGEGWVGEHVFLPGLLFSRNQSRSQDCFAACLTLVHHGRTWVLMSREGLVATLWTHQAEMGMWDSFQGQCLSLQENSKSSIMLGRTVLEFMKALCSLAASNSFASVWWCCFKFYIEA